MELQFYTSASALLVQCLLWFTLWVGHSGPESEPALGKGDGLDTRPGAVSGWSWQLILCFAVDGVAYHLQVPPVCDADGMCLCVCVGV